MKYIVGLVFCVFMGMTAISLGFGAIFPSINEIAQPMVCPNGEMAHQTTSRSPMPGRTYIQTSWACVDPSGNAAPISSFEIALYAGSVHGVILFAILVVLGKLFVRRAPPPQLQRPAMFGQQGQPFGAPPQGPPSPPFGGPPQGPQSPPFGGPPEPGGPPRPPQF